MLVALQDMGMVLAHCGSLLLDPAALQEVGSTVRLAGPCMQTCVWQCGLVPNVQSRWHPIC